MPWPLLEMRSYERRAEAHSQNLSDRRLPRAHFDTQDGACRTPETLRERTKSVPRGRLASPQDHASAVLFLVSGLADCICGIPGDANGGGLPGWYDVETYRIT